MPSSKARQLVAAAALARLPKVIIYKRSDLTAARLAIRKQKRIAAVPVTTRINRQLRKLGIPQRLVRGRGYYYVTGVAVSSALYVCWLEPSDYQLAADHVNGVLAQERKTFPKGELAQILNQKGY